jgi:hypothetical protein
VIEQFGYHIWIQQSQACKDHPSFLEGGNWRRPAILEATNWNRIVCGNSCDTITDNKRHVGLSK